MQILRHSVVIASVLLAVACPAVSAGAQTATVAAAPAENPMSGAERAAVIEDLARTLADRYVFPDVGQRYAAMLRANLAKGAYDSLSDPAAFGRAVTAELQTVSADKHLRLAPASAFARALQMQKGPAAGEKGSPPPAMDEPRMIGDVAYLNFHIFPHDHDAIAAKAHQFLVDHADARAVIIDSRDNHGGDPTLMDPIFSLLFGERTTLVRMDTRAAASDGAPQGPTAVRREAPASLVRFDHVAVPDPNEARLRKTPVYYLVSSKTGSAAEHVALAFKRTHRALLIGETTAGYGHYGGVEMIDKRFAAFVPVGRTYDPDTDWDWEGVGVTPDVVMSAGQALDEALKRAHE